MFPNFTLELGLHEDYHVQVMLFFFYFTSGFTASIARDDIPYITSGLMTAMALRC